MSTASGDDDDAGFSSMIGRKIASIPCLRDSLIAAIAGGFLLGAGFFVFTSRGKRSVDVGFFSGVTLLNVEFLRCKFARRQQERELQLIRQAMISRMLMEGTKHDKETQPINSDKLVPSDELEEFERRAANKLHKV